MAQGAVWACKQVSHEDSMNRTILVVDDDKKIVDLVSLYLKRDGYGVLDRV